MDYSYFNKNIIKTDDCAVIGDPLVSIFLSCKNSERTLRRSIESIVSVSRCYPNIEYVIQDGVSKDNTLRIIAEYAPLFGDRLKLVSEEDSGATEGFWRAMQRCSGDIICCCQSDEELLPNALDLAIDNFRRLPGVAAIFGAICTTDIDGNVLAVDEGPQSFEICEYLCGEFTPHFAASFFRRSCLETIGLFSNKWKHDTIELEFWTRLALKYPIAHVPGIYSKYARHSGAESSNVNITKSVINKSKSFLESFFNENNLPADIINLNNRAFAGVYIKAAWHYLAFEINSPEEARKAILEALKYQPYPEHHLYPSFVTKLYDYGFELCNKGEFERALDFLTLVDNTGIYATNIYFYRALALSKLGRYLEARSVLDKERAYNSNSEVIALMQFVDSKLNSSALSKYETLLKDKAAMLDRIVSERNSL